MAKTIEDYKRDYADAAKRGDAAGMAAANQGANEIRAAQGQAPQYATNDINKVSAGGQSGIVTEPGRWDTGSVNWNSLRNDYRSGRDDALAPGTGGGKHYAIDDPGEKTLYPGDPGYQDYVNNMSWTKYSALMDELEYQREAQSQQQKLLEQMAAQYANMQQPAYQHSAWDDTMEKLAAAALDANYDDWTQSGQYKALADRYGDQGKMSMQNLLAQISSRTGGLASSYATTAAQQQYNDYMAQLEAVARNQFNDERKAMIQNAQLAGEYSDRDYQKYLDQLAQYNADRSYGFDVLSKALENSRYNQEWANTLERQKLEDDRYNDATAYERGIYDDETAYSRGQDTQKLAAAQVDDFIKTGTMPSDALIAASGYDRGYVEQMAKYYANLLSAQSGTGSYGGNSGSSRSSGGGTSSTSNQTSGKSATSGNKGNLDYDEDEGIFTWNGKRYNSVESLQKALNSASLTDDQVRKLKQSLKMYGFDT